jgi:hypothetical protein
VYNHSTIATLAMELAVKMGVPLEQNSSASANGSPAADLIDEDELTALLSALRQLPTEEAQRLLEPKISPERPR